MSSVVSTQVSELLPVHNFALVVLGMNLFDDRDLDRLAAGARRRWDFLMVAPPPAPERRSIPLRCSKRLSKQKGPRRRGPKEDR